MMRLSFYYHNLVRFLNRSMVLLSALAVLAVFSWCSSASAQPTAVILSHDGDYREALAAHSSVLLDGNDDVTIDHLLTDRAQMMPISQRYVDFGLTDARIWLRTSLENSSQKSGVWRLDLRRQFVRSLDVYIVREGQEPVNILRHRNDDLFSMRPIPDRYLAVDVPIAAQETVDIYVTYRSDAASWLPFMITTREAYAVSHAQENSVNWVINGALFAILIIVLILSPVVRWQISAAFCAYIISSSLFVFNSEGYAFQYLWPNMPELNDPMDLVFILMMAAAGPAFGRVLFDIETNNPQLNRVLVGVIIASILLAFLTFPLFQYHIFKLIAYPMVVVSSLLHIVVAGYAFVKKLPGATPILIGACCILGAMIYAVIANLSPGIISLEHTLDIGHAVLLVEAIAFAAAIAIRLNWVRLDHERALRTALKVAHEKAQLNEALSKSQADYDTARTVAVRRREELSSMRHDIAQPLASLRAAMVDLEGVDEETTQKMHASFDYLETLARNEVLIDRATGADPQQNTGHETFDLTSIVDNIVMIFSGEAATKGLELRYRRRHIDVTTDPLDLMRMISNLVSNAIKYTEQGAVLISLRCRQGKAEIGVWDTGAGMDQAALIRVRQWGEKGVHSSGDGMGLCLVSETAEHLQIGFEICSRPGHGTTAKLILDAVK